MLPCAGTNVENDAEKTASRAGRLLVSDPQKADIFLIILGLTPWSTTVRACPDNIILIYTAYNFYEYKDSDDAAMDTRSQG